MADVETCSFSHTSVPPTVILSLLDFEPLVFDLSRTPPARRQARRKRGPGFREVPQWEEEDDQHDGIGKVESTNNTFGTSSDGAQDDDGLFNNRKPKTTATTRVENARYSDKENGHHHRKSFFCCKGKSSIFTANPADLSRALRTQSALTFLVASKLSQSQVGFREKNAGSKTSSTSPSAGRCTGHVQERLNRPSLSSRWSTEFRRTLFSLPWRCRGRSSPQTCSTLHTLPVTIP